jgi:hypothetical protein
VLLSLQPTGKAAQLRIQLLVRELMDVEARGARARTWHLRSFLDQLNVLGRELDAWAEKSDAEVFATLYQLIGAVSYFAISGATLSGMYGEQEVAGFKRAFVSQLEMLIDDTLRV